MDQTHIHLMLNHVAILGAVFSFLLLLSGALFRQDVLRKAALIGLILSALTTIPVFLTGEAAEESVENIPGVTEATIEAHEEAGEWALWMIGATGAAAAVALLLGIGPASKGRNLVWVVYLLALLSSAAMLRTGWLGGKIRHTELGAPAVAGSGGEEDDD